MRKRAQRGFVVPLLLLHAFAYSFLAFMATQAWKGV